LCLGSALRDLLAGTGKEECLTQNLTSLTGIFTEELNTPGGERIRARRVGHSVN
jgi:hypothetical protein